MFFWCNHFTISLLRNASKQTNKHIRPLLLCRPFCLVLKVVKPIYNRGDPLKSAMSKWLKTTEFTSYPYETATRSAPDHFDWSLKWSRFLQKFWFALVNTECMNRMLLSNSGLRNCHLGTQIFHTFWWGKTEQVHLTSHLGNSTLTLRTFWRSKSSKKVEKARTWMAW